MTQDAPAAVYEKTQQDVSELVKGHLGVVKRIVHRLPACMCSSISRDDLISAGMVGLVEAAHRYEPDRGASFVTFAYRRVRGAVIDFLRRRDSVSKSARQRMTRLRRQIREFREREGRKPSVGELAAATGLQEDTVTRLLSYERWDDMASLDSTVQDAEGSSTALAQLVPGEQSTPLQELERKELVERLTDALERLPDRQQKVLVLYYYEELYMKEIGEVLGLSESRISQLHSQALYRLSREME